MVLVLAESFIRLVDLIRFTIYRMVKRVRRLVSGQCEIARVCGEPRDNSAAGTLKQHSTDMSAKFLVEWQNSSKLTGLYNRFSSPPGMDMDEAVAAICKTKNIPSGSACMENLRHCVSDIGKVTVVKKELHERLDEPYDRENEVHEAKLESLWEYLLPGQERQGGRLSKEWNRIGFQQSDPASDFRGGGVLALDQLLHIASNRTAIARKMIVQPADESARYPWACVGINLTREAVRVVDKGWLDRRLLGKTVQDGMDLIADVYSDMFEILHHNWIEANPENVLAFPQVFKETMANVDRELAKTGVLVPPGAHA